MPRLYIGHFHGVISKLKGTSLEVGDYPLNSGKEQSQVSEVQFQALNLGLNTSLRMVDGDYHLMLTEHSKFGQR